MIVQGVVAIVYAIEIALLLCASHPDYKEKYYVGTKMLCSVSFLGIAVLFAAVSKHWNAFLVLFVPLVLCLIGDLFMAFYQLRKRKRDFFLGLVLFLFAHLGFIYMLFQLNSSIRLWNIVLPIVVFVTFWSVKKQMHLHLGKLLVPSSVYSIILAFMLSKCLQQMVVHPTIATAWLGLAGMLFFISDVTLLFLYFYKFSNRERRRMVHYMNLVTYYFAMLAFDMSILYLYAI